MEQPEDRDQLTFGSGSDEGAAFSADGERLYFASDREDEIFDIYRLDLATRELYRLTYVTGGAINPVPGNSIEGERVGFQAYHRGVWDLYVADADQGEKVGTSEPVGEEVQLEPFVPAVSIAIDPDKGKKLRRRKLFLEDGQLFVGVDNTQNFLSQTFLTFSDQYGDRRLLILFSTIDTFSNFTINWMNLEPRFQWGATLYDYRTFYITGWDPNRGDVTARQQAYRVTALEANGQYPFSRYYRAQGGVGYVDREANYPVGQNPDTGELTFETVADNGPFVSVGLAGDTTIWNSYGPHKGTRWELSGLYVHDLNAGGVLTKNFEFDGRAYVALSRRNELAFRLFLGMADGNRPHIYAIGGLDTIRGMPTRAMSGNRVGLANMEWRFPLIDRMDLPFLTFGGIRGRVFMDVGAAWWDVNGNQFNYLGEPGFTFIEDGRLVDGVSSYGFGLTIYLFGLPMHWDWVKLWDFKSSYTDRQVEFWMGVRF
jgi:hypothetical protein